MEEAEISITEKRIKKREKKHFCMYQLSKVNPSKDT
jgi:hypothetical protein